MTAVLRWEEPPPHGNSKAKAPYKYQPIADALKARPGEGALVRDDIGYGSAGAFVHRIKVGWTCFAPGGSFEAKVRPGGKQGMSKVYARYVGDPS